MKKKKLTQNDVLELLKEEVWDSLPSGEQIFLTATRRKLRGKIKSRLWIRSHFSELVEDIQLKAYELYQREERKSVSAALRTVFGKLLPRNPKASDVFDVLEENFRALDRLFLSLTQGRRVRAGKAFEHVIKVLFDILDYPYTPQPVINGQPDFLLPSEEHFHRNAMDCIIFTVKRTLRERWRQIVTEGTRGYMFFLATIDEGIAARDMKEIQNHRIYLVMPERIRSEVYSDYANVISFESFLELHLDPAMTRWRKSGVIK